MKRWLFYIIIVALFTACKSKPDNIFLQKGIDAINRTNAEKYINYLASDDLKGREAGSENGVKAAEFLTSTLIEIGVNPFFDKSFEQPFEICGWKNKRNVFNYALISDSIKTSQKYDTVLKCRNIVGKIDGEKSDEYVVVGAHYDHIGFGLAVDGDSICNGADDNASGTAGVLQIAKAFLSTGVKPKCSIIIALWDAEEKGLFGSDFFVRNFTDISKIKGCVNLDMIGRDNPNDSINEFFCIYNRRDSIFEKWINSDIKTYGFDLVPNYIASNVPGGGSDNTAFDVNGVPSVSPSTYIHKDYHKPSDEADKIAWNKTVDITKLFFLIAWRLAN